MLRNYLKTAIRNILRNRTYTLVNVSGLSAGIAVCMMIFIVIQYHTSFDTFHSKKDRIYRIITENPAEASRNGSTKDVPFPLPANLKASFPIVEQVVPLWESHNDQLILPDSKGGTALLFKENKGVFFAGPEFFETFDFPLVAGTYESLKNPNTVLLTQETAEKYFGSWQAAMGKTLKLQAGGSLFSHGVDVITVTGILANVPRNTDFQMRMAVSYGTGITEDMSKHTDWEDRTNSAFGCFVLLPANTSLNGFNQQLLAWGNKMKAPGNQERYQLQSLQEVHYDTQTGNYSNKTISHQLINVLWQIAAFILLIACVNFINLSTALAVNRAKEVGVRKVLGSNRSQLRIQFLMETFLIVLMAVAAACLISVASLPFLNKVLELSLPFSVFINSSVAFFLIAVMVAVTVLAGFYPSLVLSRFNPVNTLKARLTAKTTKGISLRRGLVVFQFVVAQVLIIGTLVIAGQMDFFMSQPLGFDKEAVVNVPFRIDSTWFSKADYVKQQLLAVNGVKAVSYSSNTPVEDADDLWSTLKFDHNPKDADFKAITKFADEAYVPTYALQLVAGRNLKPSPMTREFLVNESMLRSLGISKPEDILNKQISIWGDRIKCPVVGVIKDFNNRSFRNSVAPLLVATNVTMYSQAALKLETKNIAATLASVKGIWEKSFPDLIYEYRFLDEKIAGFYKQEAQLSQLYKLFAALAIFLSCLGLYGLASFMAVQRIKEVGIRKVLGASSGNILVLFSKELMGLITLAFVIATPLAWYFMQRWLEDYAYRIPISWWVFAVGGGASVLIALITISYQALRAALANPVKSLRSE